MRHRATVAMRLDRVTPASTRHGIISICALVLSACGDPEAPPTMSEPASASVISDGAFNHGNPHFYWLPPLAKQPAYTGTPDGSLNPVVAVCEWRADVNRCGDVVANFADAA